MNYAGTELAAMAEARNYQRWILSRCRPHLGRVVLEHGAGLGTYSALLLREAIEQLIALEPAANLVAALGEQLAQFGPRAEIVAGTLEDRVAELRARGVESVVSINVLEHIDDDVRTLRAMHDVLAPGGRLILFVPALPWLYGSLDVAFEHRRRYAKRELVAKVAGAGFRIESVRFVNLPGVLPWWLSGRVLRRRTLEPGAVRFYDRFALPLVSRLEGWLPPPIGQNLLLIARREASA
jgi:SAM-dependent methyltransferase